MKYKEICKKIIAYSFYSLFLLVPLIFSGDTSELFELNKMWFTFGISAVIFATWGIKMVLEKKISIQRTPLDIPIMIFLGAHIISTIFSMDPGTSWWGYYSRFNGGLLSIICYIMLFYAFVSNLTVQHVFNSLKVLLVSGLLTGLWGFPSHFGYDPTCMLFRGQLDTTCWTDAFKPTIRTFSTLGQPAWFAAILALLIPITMSFSLISSKKYMWIYLSLAAFFYINLLFTNTRAGFLGFWIGNVLFWLLIYIRQVHKKLITKKLFLKAVVLLNIIFLFCTFIFGGPLGNFTKYTLPSIMSPVQQKQPELSLSGAPVSASPYKSLTEITDSGKIRLLVWEGAINAWKQHPIIGTGVETFAFAYYKYKPVGHNLTSEWDYLYNKAHNEYLNYLTTTGILGLGSYLAFIGLFLFHTTKRIIKTVNTQRNHDVGTEEKNIILITGLLSAFVTILITNFFGFSVVIINLCMFLIPIFIFMLGNMIHEKKKIVYAFSDTAKTNNISSVQWILISAFIIFALWMNIGLLIYRTADIAYAYGNNLNKTGEFGKAYEYLDSAVKTMPSENVYKDELAINLAANVATLYAQKDTQNANTFLRRAVSLSDEVVAENPNNVSYWKNRVRLFYTLASADTQNQYIYFTKALQAIDKAKELAPNDAKIAYNQGVMYGQTGEIEKAITLLENTLTLRPGYPDVYVALGLYYRQTAIDKNGNVINEERNKKAIETYEYYVKNISTDNKEVNDSLAAWKK